MMPTVMNNSSIRSEDFQRLMVGVQIKRKAGGGVWVYKGEDKMTLLHLYVTVTN